jgi:hypothetical protein
MAIIYSYPKNVNLLASDLLVGTSTAIVAGKRKNQTKSFSLEDLSNYVISNIPIGEIVTLNQVLTAGNASTLDAKIGKLYLYDIANTGYGRVQLSNNIFNITTVSGNDLFSNEIGLSRVWNTIGAEGVINYANLTGGRIYAMPDTSGTIALTSDIPVVTGYVPYTGAISDINIGNNSIYTNGGAKLWDDGTVEGTSFQFVGYLGSLQSAASTNAAWTLPNKSGTIALLDDIPLIPTSFGLYAQTALSTPIVYASGEASLIGAGVGTLSVPANAFKVGDSFVAKMCGNLTNANNEILHFRVRSNGVVIIDALQYTLATATNKYFDLILDFTVSKIGVAGVAELMANGVFTYNKNASNAIEGINFGKISNTVFDTTVNNTLTITAQWVTSNVANTIRSQNFTLTKVY